MSKFSCKNNGCSPSFSSLFLFQQAAQVRIGRIRFPSRSLFNLTEIADGCSTLASRKASSFQFAVSSIRSDGNRRGRPLQKNHASVRKKEGQNKKPYENKLSRSSNQEEIISLFKRIQSSISKEEPTSSEEINLKPSEKKPAADSVSDLLNQLRKYVPDKSSNTGENKLKWKRAVAKEQQVPNKESAVDFKLSRSPSNFVKRSPIPSPSAPRGKILEMKKEPTEDAGAIEKLKLPELKQAAKSRGIKGYSRLKKSELVKLLTL